MKQLLSLNHIKDLIETLDYSQHIDNGFLDTRYHWQKVDNGVEWPYYRFFYYLAKYLHPETVVELGAYQGTAAAHFAAGNPFSTVITIDHHTDPSDEENKQKVLEACKEYPNLHYIQGWTTKALADSQQGHHALGDVGTAYPEVLRVLNKRSIDILFIDSWHKYEYARIDWYQYSTLLSSPALVICDDISTVEADTISGMMRFWNELAGEKFLDFTLHPGTGLGFLKWNG